MPNWAVTDYVIVGDKKDVKKIADAAENAGKSDGQYECITVRDAIDDWCECVEYDRKEETDEEMLQIIKDYVDAYYYINTVAEE